MSHCKQKSKPSMDWIDRINFSCFVSTRTARVLVELLRFYRMWRRDGNRRVKMFMKRQSSWEVPPPFGWFHHNSLPDAATQSFTANNGMARHMSVPQRRLTYPHRQSLFSFSRRLSLYLSSSRTQLSRHRSKTFCNSAVCSGLTFASPSSLIRLPEKFTKLIPSAMNYFLPHETVEISLSRDYQSENEIWIRSSEARDEM